MANPILSLFRKIDEKLINNVGIEISEPIFYYENSDNELNYIEYPEEGLSEFRLNEFDTSWSPDFHNLGIEQQYVIKNASFLFGEAGVTHPTNELGLAAHIYSRSSRYQETVHVADIKNSQNPQIFVFKKEFDKKSIRGTINFEVFIYLKKHFQSLPFQTKLEGVNLNIENLEAFSILVDGDGSVFPIEEVEEVGGPLWKVDFNWTDIETDSFSSSNVKLLLNRAHPIYNYLYNEKHNVNKYLMNEIILSAMVLIIQKAILIDKESISEDNDYSPGSIAQVLLYWITTFEVRLDSLESISESLHKNADLFNRGDR